MKRIVRRAWVLLAVAPGLTLAGCAPRAQTVEPPVEVPERFTAAGGEPLPNEWWWSFGDSELNELVARALAGNLALLTAWDRLAQAEAESRRVGAPLLPSVDATFGAARSLERRDIETPGGSTTDRDAFSTFSTGLLVAYELDLWGRIRNTYDAARYDQLASADDVRAAAITLSASVATTWYRLVEQVAQIEVLDEQIATNETVLEVITLRFRRGQANAADVLRQRQLVESRRGDRIEAGAAATILEHQLAVLLGRAPTATVAGRRSELIELPALPATGVPAAVLRRRPDVRRSFHRVLASDRRLAAAIADQYPRVSLSASASTSAQKTRDLFENWIATMAANIAAPVFDGGRRRAEVERNRAVISEQLHDYGQSILDALTEVEDALVLEARRRELIVSVDRQLDLARQSMDRIRDQYTNGSASYLDVLNALLSYQALQRTKLAARRQLIEDRIGLCRSIAGGWEMQRPALAVLEEEPAPHPAGANDAVDHE